MDFKVELRSAEGRVVRAADPLARALHRGEATLRQRLEQARESTLANTLAADANLQWEATRAAVEKRRRPR